MEQWSGRWDSNPRLSAWEADTLPLSYARPATAGGSAPPPPADVLANSSTPPARLPVCHNPAAKATPKNKPGRPYSGRPRQYGFTPASHPKAPSPAPVAPLTDPAPFFKLAYISPPRAGTAHPRPPSSARHPATHHTIPATPRTLAAMATAIARPPPPRRSATRTGKEAPSQ